MKSETSSADQFALANRLALARSRDSLSGADQRTLEALERQCSERASELPSAVVQEALAFVGVHGMMPMKSETSSADEFALANRLALARSRDSLSGTDQRTLEA